MAFEQNFPEPYDMDAAWGSESATQFAGLVEQLNGEFLPGDFIISADNSPRPGFLLCDGSAVSREEFSRLFSIIGVTYGAGDGSTTFNVPTATLSVDGNAAYYYIRF